MSAAQQNQPLDVLTRAAEAAGRAARRYFRAGAATTAAISYKAGNSPVTEADFAADAAARAVLSAGFPGVPILSEEDAVHTRLGHGRAVVMDPIDGTRAFMAGRSEWCVSLALMEDGAPVAGVIHAPARGELFAAAKGRGATLNGAPLPRRAASARPRITGPARLLDQLTQHWPPTESGDTLKALAYRLVSVAAGAHDVAVATPGASHWDIAAAHIILAETGCVLRSLSGQPPVYIGTDPVHPALIAAEEGLAGRLLAALTRVSA